MLSRSRFLIVPMALLSLSAVQAGAPKLQKVAPQVGQRGQEVEVELRGLYLSDPQDVLFYEPGVLVQSLEMVTEQEVNGKTVPVDEGTRLKLKVKLTDACPLGPLGFRVRTSGGFSEYQRFFVSPFEVVNEIEANSREKNDEPKMAQAVSGNQTVVGTLRESYDLDYYKFSVKQGERITAEVIAARLGVERGLPDLHLTVFNAKGESLQKADDSALYLQDPVLSVVAPETGDYFVEVRHSLYSANNDNYVLHLGNYLRPTAIYPAGGPPGTELAVELLGDPLGTQKQTLKLPQEVTVGLARRSLANDDSGTYLSYEVQDARTKTFAGTPNTIRVSPLKNVLESAKNDSADDIAAESAVELPAAFNGIIEKSGDVDCFKFTAKKGERYRFHIYASALGSPVDATIWVKSANGKGGTSRASDSRITQHGLPSSNGVERQTIDPVLQFNVPADGEYVLGVEDERGNGGADYVYRIEAAPDREAAFVYIPPEPDNRFAPQARQAVNVPAGGRYNTTLSVVNVNRAYEGELELVAVGLPEGVEMHAQNITPEMPRVPVVFTAKENASLQGTFAEIFVRPVASEKNPKPEPLASGFCQHLAMNAGGNNDYYLQIPLDKLAIAVTEPAGFDLEVEQPPSSLVQNGEMSLKFKVIRKKGYEGSVTVMMEWKPNGLSTSTPLNIPADQDEGEYLLSAARNAAAGTYQVTLTGVNGNYQASYRDPNERVYVAAKPIKLTIAEPHLDAKFGRASVERGKTAELVVTLNHLKPFSGTAKVSLARLPRGVVAVEEFREISANDKQVSFTLKATEESLVGNYRGMTLDVTVEDAGQSVRQFTGYGSLRVDAQRGGKPSS